MTSDWTARPFAPKVRRKWKEKTLFRCSAVAFAGFPDIENGGKANGNMLEMCSINYWLLDLEDGWEDVHEMEDDVSGVYDVLRC